MILSSPPDTTRAVCGMRCKSFSMPARAFATVSSSRRPPSRTPHRLQMTAIPDSASSVTSFLMPPSSKNASSFSISFFMSNRFFKPYGVCVYDTYRGISCQEANKKELQLAAPYMIQKNHDLRKPSQRCVGGDAHIAPREVSNSPEISVKTGYPAGSMWASTPTR